MQWIHWALLVLSAIALALSAFYAIRAVSGRPHRARRAARAGAAGFLLLLVDALGRAPVVLHAAEISGDRGEVFWTAVDVAVRNALPVFLWGLALFGRWRGWLADVVFATAILIAAGLSILCYLVPLPGHSGF